jgi:hypothetical protein
MTDWDNIDWGDEEEFVDPYSYVLGLDPGGTTGVALLRYTENTLPQLVYLHQIPDGLQGFHDFFEVSYPDRNVTIVSEKWKERNIKGADRTPVYIEGYQFGLWYVPIKRGEAGEKNGVVVYQYPEVKELVTDEFLKSQNLWTPGKPHQMDALRHAIAYLRNNRHRPTQKSMSGEPQDNENPDQLIADPGEAESKELGEGDAKDAAEAMEQAGEAAREAAEAMSALAEALSEGDPAEAEGQGEPNGSGGNGGQGEGRIDPDISQKRKRRERNGVFAGFDPDGEESVLYDLEDLK